MRQLFPIHKGRVLFWGTLGKQYGCNPMYISKYLVQNEKYFDVWWMFIKGTNINRLGINEKSVRFGGLKYLYIINTAEFIITNHRTRPKDFFWKKRKNQKYIMTWHGSMPIKKVENDAIESIGLDYVKAAKADSKICDLMLSDSEFFTKLLSKSFWYSGEILKTTMPRNQKFYEKNNYRLVRNKVINYCGENKDEDLILVLYAPTFRSNNNLDSYITKWDNIKSAITSKYNKRVIILMRLHPNMLQVINTDNLINSDYVKNASEYDDMQELMVASDILITDYSSTMFEFSMMQKPCFLYMPDKEKYDRGFYFNLSELPFAKSETVSELISDIENSDNFEYKKNLFTFVNKYFGLYKKCNGSAKVCEWMIQHRIL